MYVCIVIYFFIHVYSSCQVPEVPWKPFHRHLRPFLYLLVSVQRWSIRFSDVSWISLVPRVHFRRSVRTLFHTCYLSIFLIIPSFLYIAKGGLASMVQNLSRLGAKVVPMQPDVVVLDGVIRSLIVFYSFCILFPDFIVSLVSLLSYR